MDMNNKVIISYSSLFQTVISSVKPGFCLLTKWRPYFIAPFAHSLPQKGKGKWQTRLGKMHGFAGVNIEKQYIEARSTIYQSSYLERFIFLFIQIRCFHKYTVQTHKFSCVWEVGIQQAFRYR